MGWGSDAVAAVLRALDLKYAALVPGASYRGLHDSIVNYLGNENPQDAAVPARGALGRDRSGLCEDHGQADACRRHSNVA